MLYENNEKIYTVFVPVSINIDKQKALRRDCIYNVENADLEI